MCVCNFIVQSTTALTLFKVALSSLLPLPLSHSLTLTCCLARQIRNFEAPVRKVLLDQKQKKSVETGATAAAAANACSVCSEAQRSWRRRQRPQICRQKHTRYVFTTRTSGRTVNFRKSSRRETIYMAARRWRWRRRLSWALLFGFLALTSIIVLHTYIHIQIYVCNIYIYVYIYNCMSIYTCIRNFFNICFQEIVVYRDFHMRFLNCTRVYLFLLYAFFSHALQH